MAKKNRERLVVEKNERAIKRGCRLKTAGRIFAIVFVLIYIGIIVGSTVFAYKTAEKAWDENIGIEAGVPFKDLFTIFKGVRKADENVIVTNAYGEDDVKEFYSNVKRKTYLSEDFDLDIMKLLGAVMGGEGESETAQVDLIADGMPNGEQDGETPEDETVIETTGSSALDNLLNELEFDFSSLSAYDGSKNILEISDKQLAAFFSEVLTGLGEYFPQISEIEESLGVRINEVLEIKQIIISGDALKPESVSLKVTIGLKMKELVSGLVKAYELPSIITSIMPQYLYASVTVYPCDRTRGIQVAINAMSEVNVDKIVSIADVVLKKTGQEISIASMLIDVNSKVVDVIEKAQEFIPIVFTASEGGAGTLDTYPIETLMKFLGVEVSEQAFLYMIKDIKLPTAETLGFDVYTQAIKDRDTQAFIVELTGKYGIDNSDNRIGAENTISDVLNFAQGDDIINRLNLNSIVHPEIYSEKDVKVAATYQALSNMLTAYVNGEGMLGNIQATIVNASCTGNVLAVDIEVNVAAMLGLDGGSSMAKLVTQLVPESIFATAYIALEDETPTSVEINKVGVSNSQEHLQTMTSLAESFGMDVSSLGYDYICEQVDSGIRQGLAQIKEQLGYEIVFDRDKAYLPSLYELISGTDVVNGNLEEDEHYFTPQEIHKLLKHLYNASYAFDAENNQFALAENLNAFIDELYEKFFISDSYRRDLQTASEENKLLDTLTNIGGDTFAMTNLRLEDVKDEYTGKITVGLTSRSNVTDTSSGDIDKINQEIISKFNPVFSLEELAYLIGSTVNFEQALTFMKDVEIVYANNYSAVGDDYLELVLRGKGNITNNNATSLLPEYIYLGVSIDLGKGQADGSRSDMNVFQMDVHRLNYAPDASGNEIQDLQLLTMLIDRVNANANSGGAQDPSEGDDGEQPEPPSESEPVKTTSLEKIVSDIEVKLNGSDGQDGGAVEEGFKDKLHNETFTVDFIDGGGFIIAQTIYQITLNAIYGDAANDLGSNSDKPSEIDFRNALCKTHVMPESVTIDGRELSLAVSNKTQADRAVEEINEKYAFTAGNQITTGDMQGVFSDIGNKISNYANAIDGAKLTSAYDDGTQKTIENLRPEIFEGELLTFLENSVTLTAKGYEDTEIFGLYITARDEMAIIYRSGVKHTGSKYDELMPATLAMLVSVDTTLLKSDDECTKVFFNDLSESEVKALEGVRNKIYSTDGSTASTLEDASKQCSDSVKNTMSALTDNMDIQYDFVGGKGVMTLQSVYEVAAAKISEATPEQKAIGGEELKATLEGLFAGLDLYGYIGPFADGSSVSGTQITMGDGNISSKISVEQLQNNLKMSNAATGALLLKQSAIVSAGDGSLAQLRASLGGGRLDNGKNYFLLTYEADTQSAIGASLSMLPSKLYLTMYFDMSDTSKIYMVYCSLSDGQADIFARLASVNADGASAFTDSGNLAGVREQMLGTTVYGSITLADLFSRGACKPISQVSGNNVLGVGALTFANS